MKMNRIRKTVTTLRNHWKKTVFFTSVTAYGSSILWERLKVYNIMKNSCLEAVSFGDTSLRASHPSRHVTVILNPVANKRKAKLSYEKYVAPLLNCAGLKVSLIQTESEGQGKELMEIMNNTDAVIIAGGSGLIHESVTGFLRRKDGIEFPLGIIPLGQMNRTSSSVHCFDFKRKNLVTQVQETAETTMSVIRETVKKIDVLRVKSKEKNRYVYAVDSLSFGSIQDVVSGCDSYWYLGNRMKPFLAMISRTLFRDLSLFRLDPGVDIKFTDPCDGCKTCRGSGNETAKNEQETDVKEVKRWWSPFVPRKPMNTETTSMSSTAIDYDSIVNEKCGQWKHVSSSDSLINVFIENHPRQKDSSLLLHKDKEISKGPFIFDGVDIRNGIQPSSVSSSIPFKDLEISVKKNESQEATNQLLIIDGEEYELHDLIIERIPEKLTIYSKA